MGAFIRILFMKEIIHEVELGEETIAYIEKLNYEKTGYLTLFRTIASHNKGAVFFEQLRNEYLEKNAEYMLVFEEIKNTYIPEDILKILTPSHKMSIDFNKKTLTVHIGEDEGGSCCGI